MSGRVVDPTGAVIPSASIEVTNTGTGLDRTVSSSATGEYTIPSLPVGTYSLKATGAGFKTYAQSGIVLEDGQNARVDVVLQVGSTNETVEVSAQATQVDTSSATVRTEVDSTQIKELPLNTRNTLQLITLVPGVGAATLPPAVINQRNGPTFSVNGSRVNGSEVSLDGAIFVTGLYNRPANLPNPDSIGEFSLITNNAGAEYGHASGGAFVAVSKAGTNSFHGSAWEFLRNDALNARNWFAPAPAAKPILKQNQFGVAGGGPVLKNKVFFFATYEGLRIHQVTLENLATITPAQRSGDFSALTAQLHDPYNATCGTNGNGPGTGSTPCNYTTANGYAGTNQIPKSEWDTMSVAFMNTYIPTPTLQPSGQWAYTDQVATPTSGNQYTIRGDYRVTKNDQAYVRFFHMVTSAVTGPPYSSIISSKFYDNFSNSNWGTTVRDTHTFSSNLIGDFGFSDTNLSTTGTPEGTIITGTQMGAQYNTGGYNVSPLVSVSGVTSFGSGNPWYENTALKQADAKLSWVKGKHLWQFGAMALREAENIEWIDTNSAGNPTFSGIETGNNWADYLIGKPISFGQYTPYYGNEHSVELGFYAQDAYKASSRLTLNLGVRWDLFFPWVEFNHDSPTVTFDPSFHSTRFPTAPPGLAFPGDPGIPSGTIFMDKGDFAPRLGFAYDVFGDGKTSVRGGYGIFYNAPGAITMANEIEAPPFETQLVFTPNTFTNPYGGTGYTNPFPYPYLNPGTNPLWPFPAQFYSPDPHLKNAFTQQYNFNVQHEFPKDFMVQAGYVGSHGNQLWDGNQANAAPYSAGGTAANAQSRRPFLPQYYAGITRIANIGFSNYNSMQITARKRFSADYTMQFAYTFAKSLDAGSYADADGGTAQNPASPIAGEYARSDFNQKHLLSVNGVWNLPQFEKLGPAKYAAGGWMVSGIVSYSSGTPFSVTTGSAAPWLGAGRDIGALRLNVTGTNPCAGCGGRDSWARTGYFNTTAFASPLVAPAVYGTFGNSGRNSLVGPSYFDTDMSLVKNFPLLFRENSKVQFRADFFNLFNNVNFSNPTTSSASSVFGKITSAQNARQVQLALRLDF
ncbi:cell envelope biogenesis protein OmpA [Edaphobacter acidisoli]|uniref:Cell envelope biogenesis protein OmpA n=1 Tax=Edaphobacter acidisoli TaxID=2040573 RepID=A0A916RUZ9_9BACT|nr:TonB-dependent receptor [Edaphobacter acidisoli]GGA67439.1 cell envelope biogenesis protein OmpA [Edaphobacter acidisoli]